VVTLASIYPVCFVLILGLAVGGTVTVADILERQQSANTTTTSSSSPSNGSGVNVTVAGSGGAGGEQRDVNPSFEEQSAWETTPLLELYLTVRAFVPLVVFLLGVFKWMKEPLPLVSIGPSPHHFRNKTVWHGFAASFVGLFVFNIGLTKGLSVLGGDVGAALPGLFMHVDGNDARCVVHSRNH